MARIVLKDGITLMGARRVLSKRGSSVRITQRNGKLFTFKKFKCVQPNSERQMECREMLKRANELAKKDMAREGRKEYWMNKAKEMGYKTAMGCARAWYMAELRGKENGEKEKKMTRRVWEHAKSKREERETKRETIEIGKKWKRLGRWKWREKEKKSPQLVE